MKPLALRGGKAISKRKPPNDTRVAQKNVSKVIPVSPGMSSRASTLETVNEAYERKKKWNTLENSLETGNTSRRQSATQHSYRQPFLSAIDTAAAALSDGKLNDFAQVTSFWNGERAKATLVNRMEATRQLQSTIDTLVDLKDVECLRFFVNVLDGALSENIASDRQLDINRSTSSSQYKLLSPLGTKRLRLLLNNTVEKMLALDESYISTVEKISLLDRCSRRTLFAQGTSRKGLCVPFALQTAFSQFVEGSPSYSDDLLPQINPALASGFVHPAQYKLQQTLALSKSEAKYIKDNWEVTFSSPASKEDSWEHFLNSFRSKSPLVDHAELNHLILSLKCSAAPSQEEREKARDAIRKALLNSNQSDKKLLTMLLLRDRTLRQSLNMSSGSLYSLYLLNTRSENIPRKFGGKLVKTIKALQKRGNSDRAARIILNHMVCDTASTRRLMARHPELCDVCTAALVDALRKPSAESRKWTGRKVLAFMEVVKESERFSPTHGVALGVVASDLGVPMGLVRNSLSKVIPDKETEEWCVNLIRICGSSNDEQYDYKTKSYIQKEQNEAFFTKIPNRSKQLALWSTVRSSNPLLTQLVTRLFLDAGAREAFVGCCAGVTEDASKSGKNSANTTSEIVAALASNCTSDKPLCAFLSALINQSGASDTRRAKLTQLLKSETDSDAPRPT